MHANDIDTYEGPPCEMCRRIMFVGTCTHRPHKRPTLPDIKLTDQERAELEAMLKKLPERKP